MSDDENKGKVTRLLIAWSQGKTEAMTELLPLVYRELRALARQSLRRERREHSLQSTALIHEAYLRLVKRNNPYLQSRAEFFAVAAQAMRRVLVDHARSRKAGKRSGRDLKIALSEAANFQVESETEVIALDDALERLATVDQRHARVVELRYFGGLTIEETAKVLGVSPTTVKQDWNLAKAWLYRQLAGD